MSLQQLYQRRTRGFTLLFAVLISSILLAIGMGIFNIVYRELQLSALARDSTTALFSADAGIECGLYWEYQDKFDPEEINPVVSINCAGTDMASSRVVVAAVTEWSYTFRVGEGASDESCVVLNITKDASDPLNVITTISSSGRNEGGATCTPGNRTVERTLEVHY